MSEKRYDLIMAVFDSEKAASDSFKILQQEEKKKLIDTKNVVVITKEAEGKIHIKETAEKAAGEIGIGALVGGALGILAGPVGLITLGAAGAVLGGLTAKLDDVGFDDEKLERIGEALQPGSSAIITVLEEQYSDHLAEELKTHGAKVVVEDLPVSFERFLDEGEKWAYRVAEGEVDEAASELGLRTVEPESYVSDFENHEEMKSSEDDPDAPFPKF